MKHLPFVLTFLLSVPALAKTLIIGDSHIVGPLGEKLHGYFHSARGEEVRTVGLAGATATSFTASEESKRTLSFGFADRKNAQSTQTPGGKKATAPLLKNLLSEEKPDRFIVELGDNFANYRNGGPVADKAAAQQIREIIDTLKKSGFHGRCYWVTPTWTDKEKSAPYYKDNARLAQLIAVIRKEASPRCTVIDSTQEISKDKIKTTADGLHFDARNGGVWAQAVSAKIEALERNSRAGGSPSQGAR